MNQLIVKICTGRSCSERFSSFIKKRLEGDKEFYHYDENIVIEECLCQGRCKEGPTVIFDTDVQVSMNPIKASEILRRRVEEWKNHQMKANELPKNE